ERRDFEFGRRWGGCLRRSMFWCNPRPGGRALFVLEGKVGIPGRLFRVPGVAINALQSAKAYSGFSKSSGTGVQGPELLVQTQIPRSFGQGRQQGCKR